MASLVPCTVCQRHVRRVESVCPFCGAERQPTASTSRESGLPRDAKRATLVALGLALAGPACGGRGDDADERDNSSIIAPYGLSPPASEGGSGGSGGAAAGGGSGGASGSAGGDEGDVSVPPYGAMPPPDPDGGGGGGADTPDAGTPPDAGADDADASDAG